MEWSENGQDWQAFILGTGVSVRVVPSTTLSGNLRQAIQEDLASDKREPLAYELFHEAVALKESSPRSALLTLVSAAEFSVKSCISELAPETEWLIMNMPSPDVAKLMLEYPPLLSEDARRAFRGSRDPNVSEWLQELTAATHARNALAHRGQAPPSQESLDRKFTAILSLLRLMDYFSGRPWAREYLTEEWLRKLRLLEHDVISEGSDADASHGSDMGTF